jgi:hypothetical protein
MDCYISELEMVVAEIGSPLVSPEPRKVWGSILELIHWEATAETVNMEFPQIIPSAKTILQILPVKFTLMVLETASDKLD